MFLYSVQTIINASANKVDNMIKEISSDDVCKLKTYISILKRYFIFIYYIIFRTCAYIDHSDN